jgi:hypothetical protein
LKSAKFFFQVEIDNGLLITFKNVKKKFLRHCDVLLYVLQHQEHIAFCGHTTMAHFLKALPYSEFPMIHLDQLDCALHAKANL